MDMRYEDFALQIEARADGSCRARVIASPAGEATGTFTPPVSRAEIDAIAEQVASGVERSRRKRGGAPAGGRGAPDPPVAPPELRDVGARLFRALFTPEVRSRYDHSLGRLAQRDGCGLRLKLHMALDDPATAHLHDLPWEYLLRPDDNTFLSLSRDTVVVRYLSLPLAGGDRALPTLPLRILAVTAAPNGVAALDLDREMETLRRAWCSVPGVEVAHLTEATLDALRQALLEREYHVLHFMGHGALDASGEGVLCFEDDTTAVRLVSGPELAQQLRDFKSLRLVVLNACESARAASAAPFTGAATALLQAGVPAVLAMQFEITDEAALAFSEAFYRRLAAADPVDTAVAEGRLAVHRRLPGTLEWGTPVLFLRAPDGRLFQEPPPAPSPVFVPPAAPTEPTVPPTAPFTALTATPVATPHPTRRHTGTAATALVVALLGVGVGVARWLTHGGDHVSSGVTPATLPSPALALAPAASPTPRPARRTVDSTALPAASVTVPAAAPALVADPMPNRAELTDIGFAVVDDARGWDPQAATLLATAWSTRRAGTRHVLMTAAFDTGGFFRALWSGDPTPLGRVRLAQQLDALLLAKKSTEFTRDPALPNIVTARTTVEAHLVDARTGAITGSAEAADLGQGGMPALAERQALERVAETLLEQIR